MNVVTPRLLMSKYGRANYLKREYAHARRYLVTAAKRGETLKAELLADWFEKAAADLRTLTQNPTDDAGDDVAAPLKGDGGVDASA